MPVPVAVAVIVAAAVGPMVFFWRQLRAGGRWGQRPAAQRVLALGGVLFFGGLLLVSLVALLLPHTTVDRALMTGGFVMLTVGELLVLAGPWLARRADERRTRSIRRGLGLD